MKRTSNGLVLACALLFGCVAAFGSTESTSWGKLKKEVQGDTQPAAKRSGAKGEKSEKSEKSGKASGDKVAICHFDEDTGLFKVINVSDNAVDKHIANHGDSLPSTYYADQDGDGFGDPSTTDACSNPGFVGNGDDAFPLDPSESVDTDGDGIGDNSDPTPNGEPVFGFVEVNFENVGVTTGPCPDCVLSAPASSSNGPIASASFEWTDTDGIAPGCGGWSVHGVLDWGSNMFVGRGLGDPSAYGGEYYYLDLDVSAAVQLTNISLLVGNNGGYTNPVNVVAFQAGQETVLGTFNLPGPASPAAGTQNVTVAIAGQLDPGPAEIRLKVQGALYSPWNPCGFNAFVYVDDIHVDFQY